MQTSSETRRRATRIIVMIVAVVTLALAALPVVASQRRGPSSATATGPAGGPPDNAPSPLATGRPPADAPVLAGYPAGAVVDVELYTDDPVTLSGELTTAGAATYSPAGLSPLRARVAVDEIRRLYDRGLFFRADVVIGPDEHATSEGLQLSDVDDVLSSGFGGQGVKVAVIDVGFLGWEALVGTDLPPADRLTTNDFWTGTMNGNASRTSAHGTAVAEIVHDLAPEAHLYLIPLDQASDLDGIVDYLLTQQVDVVNTSLGWTVGPFDGSGPESIPVQRAIDAGITWVSSAGNHADEHWGGPVSDADGDGYVEFDAEQSNDVNWIFVDNSGGTIDDYQAINVTFTDPSPDHYLCLLQWDATEGVWVEYPDTTTWCTNDDTEAARPGTRQGLVFTPAGETRYYGFALYAGGALQGDVDVFTPKLPSGSSLNFVDPAYSMGCPGCVVDVVTVAAARACDPSLLEVYSSHGPTVTFQPKPDLAGWAVVSTSAYGTVDGTLSCASQLGFNGTSAASPHVAAVAALYQQIDRDASPREVKDALIAMAADGPGGRDLHDTGWGWGTLHADPALFAISATNDGPPVWANPLLTPTSVQPDAVTLAWSGTPSTVERYRIYFTDSPADATGVFRGQLLGEVEGSQVTVDVLGLAPVTEYTFWVEAVDNGLESDDGPIVAVRTAADFADTPGHTFEADVTWLSAAGVTNGCVADVRFCPDDAVTRAQMATFLVRALGLDPLPGARFADVTGVHESNINALADAGVTVGCDPTGSRFCPDDPVTRGQMATFLARAFALAGGPGDTFTDDNGNVHEASIETLAVHGITQGCGGSRFCPGDSVTRGQMAAFLHRSARATGLTPFASPGDRHALLNGDASGTGAAKQG